MTTFNVKNQNRKTLRYGITLLVLVVIIVIAVLITKPSLLDYIKSTVESSSITQNNGITDEKNTPSSDLNAQSSDDEYIIVATKLGKIRGKRTQQMGVEVNTFLGIRYGMAPTKRLRFRKPVAVKRWSEVMNATKLPPACIQSEYTQKLFPVKILNYEISEDCLFLNIWAPNNNNTEKLPVIVWLHGGMFTIGSIGVDEYDGSVLAAFGNVIVVSVQYRLGLFGFLDLDSDIIPGNMGLLDQSLAIKWVHENIDKFGGDPNLITLMGNSAGAISIGIHMMSPVTKKYFKRVILQSGSAMLLNAVYSRGDKVAETFVQKIGCLEDGMDIFESSDVVVKCIDKVPFDKIMEVQQEMVNDNPVPFLPTIPNDYIENFPSDDDSERNQTYEQKEFLVGFNINEGNLILHLSYPKKFQRESVPQITTLDEARAEMASMAIDGGFPQSQSKSMASVLLQGNSSDSPQNWARKIGTVFGDIMFICPTIKFANKFSNANNSNVYMYVFTQKALNTVWGNWMGVTHHDEIAFMFGVALRYPNQFHGDDIDLSKRMMTAWTQFARTGSVSSKHYDYDWPLYDSANKTYLELNAKSANIGHRFHEESCNLYDALVEYLNRK